jgi:AcrR family transcriptional regulator
MATKHAGSAAGGRSGRRPVGRPPAAGRREALIAAAVDCVAESGVATTTAEIAERAGVPKSVIHYYFKTKKQLLEAAFARVVADFLAVVQRRTERDSPAPQLLEGLAYDPIPFGEEGAKLVRFWYHWVSAALSDRELMEAAAESFRSGPRTMAAHLRDLKAAGRLPSSVDPELDGLLISACTDGLILARMSGFSDDRSLYRKAVRRFVEGILARAGSSETSPGGPR